MKPLIGLSLALLFSAQATAALEARAVVKSLDRAILSGELAAKVIALPKRAGERFRKGDLLVGLNCDLYEAQAEKVGAENKVAEIKLKNAQQLNELASIGALDVALAQSEFEQTRAELKIARLNTKRCSIRAPYSGRVVSLLVNRHENIRQQQELIEIVADKRLEAELVVPAVWMKWLRAGMNLRMKIDETGGELKASVVAINPAIDPVSQTLTLRARFASSDSLIPGMSATAFFDAPSETE
ncbi:efflux RND transporter periplasmic adaptor subunit [Marinobacterium jannaschii]|uniref:efflux RND transporter periplasmic adaptor subunit n=1 Tax=Marinobacterium jannaschii TaxID=64970 RepID=UPI0004863451|nr:efflux RND transporter periplasmic adaptor subunit [Marinobacterium jannaschii]